MAKFIDLYFRFGVNIKESLRIGKVILECRSERNVFTQIKIVFFPFVFKLFKSSGYLKNAKIKGCRIV